MNFDRNETESMNLEPEPPIISSYLSNEILKMKLKYEKQHNFLSSKIPEIFEDEPGLSSNSFEKASKEEISKEVFKGMGREGRRTTAFERTGGDGLFSGENEMILPFVKNFLMRLRNSTKFRLPNKLKNLHYELINDHSYFYEKEENEKGCLKVIFLKAMIGLCSPIKNLYILTEGYTFNPYGPLRTFCDVFHFFLLILLFFKLPLDIVFADRFPSCNFILFSAIIFFIFEIVINFNTSYFSNGLLEKKRSKIFMHYINSLFIYDLLVLCLLAIPFYICCYKHMEFLKFGIFIKIYRFRSLYKKLSTQFKLQQNFKGYLDIFILLFTSILISHLIACLWVHIALLERESSGQNNNWISLRRLGDQPWYVQYLHSYYWSIVTMMTVGYGDITPQNSSEILFSVITIVFGCGVYAYNLNTVGILLSELKKDENKYNTNIRTINRFMDKKLINTELQTRIREYLRFIWSEDSSRSDSEEQHIIETLNPSLKEELLLKAYGNILKKFPMFYANFTEKSLRKMIVLMKEMKFTPGDIIYNEQELDDCSIYFINRGSVSIELNRSKESGMRLEQKKDGDCFGEEEFFTGITRSKTVKSTEFTSLFVIKREDFITIISQNADDYQKYCMIRDQILIYENFSALSLRCPSCGSQQHIIKWCPLLHFIPDDEKVIKTYDFYHDQIRSSFTRRPKIGNLVNSRFLVKKTRKAAENIQRQLKVEKENLRMARIKKKKNGINPQYDTMYLGSDMTISSESDFEEGEDEKENTQTHESIESEKDLTINIFSNHDEQESSNGSEIKILNTGKNPKEADKSQKIDRIQPIFHRYSTQLSNLHASPPSPIHSFIKGLSPSFSSQNIPLKIIKMPVSFSSTNIPIKKEEIQSIKMKKEDNKKMEEIIRKSRLKEVDRIHSLISKNGSKIGTFFNNQAFEMDRASIFKSYFPESNVTNVLEKYEKKRRKLAFLHELKMQSLNQTSDKMEYSINHLLGSPANIFSEDHSMINESNEQIRKRISKYTFYVSRMFEILNLKKKKKDEIGHKGEEGRSSKKFERNKNVKKTKSYFFKNGGEAKKLSDFVFAIMKHSKYELWKKINRTQRKSLSIIRKKANKDKKLFGIF